jgi:flagellar capping protein FliD
MPVPAGANILDNLHFVQALDSVTPSTTTPSRVSLKNAAVAGVLIRYVNASTVTGSAIALIQATAQSGGSTAALGFETYYYKLDTGAADAPWTKATAGSNTFTTSTTNSKSGWYFIPIDPATLTVDTYSHLGVTTGDGANTSITATYVLVPKFGGNPAVFPAMQA